MVERLNGIEKVRGSTPLISTTRNVCKYKGFRASVRVAARSVEGRVGCFTTLYNTLGRDLRKGEIGAYMKIKQTGSVFDNHGLWYYSVKLPGDKCRRQVPLRAPGAKHTLRTDRPRKMAEEAAARYWEEHTRQAKRREPQGVTVAELCAMWADRCREYYRGPDGKESSTAVKAELTQVKGGRRGRTPARESTPVRPVDDATVEKTVERMAPNTADMVRVHRLTGMRP